LQTLLQGRGKRSLVCAKTSAVESGRPAAPLQNLADRTVYARKELSDVQITMRAPASRPSLVVKRD
jgi:hypothetical protein